MIEERSLSRGTKFVHAFAILLVAGTWGCASAGPAVKPPRTEVVLQPIQKPSSAQPVSTADTLGSLSVIAAPQIADGDQTSQRIQKLEAADESLTTVLRGLASNYGLNLDVEPGVTGKVTTTLTNVTLREALASILTTQGYTYEITNGVLRVGGARSLTRIFPLDYVALSRFGSSNTSVNRSIGNAGFSGGGGGNDVISSSTVANLWEEIRVALDGLIFDEVVRGDVASSTPSVIATAGQLAPINPNVQQNLGITGVGGGGGAGGTSAYSRSAAGRRLIINPMAGTITVTAPPAKLAEVAAFISSFEASVQRQVLIEAKIVDVSLTKESQFGIDWSSVMKIKNLSLGIAQTLTTSSQSGVQLTLSGGGNQVNAVLRALQTQGNVNVLSSPSVSALNNQPAIMRVTTEEVVFTATRQPILGPTGGTIGFNNVITPQQISVGIVLSVTPQIGAGNVITMNIRPHINSVNRIATFISDDGNQSQVPVLDERETDTMVRIRAGETVVIGGLMQNKITHNTSGVPGLRKLPIFGRLFESSSEVQSKSELVIFITATIVAGQPPATE
jgi:MSHA biogenesis protein MshL